MLLIWGLVQIKIQQFKATTDTVEIFLLIAHFLYSAAKDDKKESTGTKFDMFYGGNIIILMLGPRRI